MAADPSIAHGRESSLEHLASLNRAADSARAKWDRQGVAAALQVLQQQALPPAREIAAALLQWYQRPAQRQRDALELAQVAAARSCAFLRCANVACIGGPAAGQGEGSKRCRWVCVPGGGLVCGQVDLSKSGACSAGLHGVLCYAVPCCAVRAARL